MSSFTSVIQKPGKKIVPKAAPRRNVPRKPAAAPVLAPDISQSGKTQSEHSIDESLQSPVPATSEVQVEEVEQHQSRVIGTSQDSQDSVINHTVKSSEPTSRAKANGSTVGEITSLAQETHEQPEPERIIISEASAAALPNILSASPAFEKSDVPSATAITSESVSSSTNSEPRTDKLVCTHQQSQDLENAVARSLRKRKATSRTEVPSSPQKRRKTASRAGSETVSSVSTPVAHNASLEQPSPSSSNQSVLPADLLQSATQRAASVSQLANSIEAQTRSLRPHSERYTSNQPESTSETDNVEDPESQPSKTRRPRRKKTAQEQADEVIANIGGKPSASGRRRGTTPEDAETHELEPAKVTMGDLCEDNRLGKKSALEIEMQENWAEIVQRRKEDRMRALENAEKRGRKGVGQVHMLNENRGPVAALAPATTVVNGVIVVDQSSREIDRAAQLQRAAVQDLDNVREDKDYYKYVNQGTIGMKNGRGQHAKWDEEATERFFKGLRMFGTDFLMIANMFPGISRKQIKSKFIREENADKARVMECLRNREDVQLDDYAQMANKDTEEFHTLESIQKELDEQEKRLREEDNQRRKREGFATTGDADQGQQEAAGDAQEGVERQTESVQPNRFDAMANEVIEAAMAPKKRQRKANTNNRRGAKASRQLEGGVEEVLGNIHEVAV